ncbi:MAG: hypothetical protein RL131_556, partial [Bacteroidota bacterium]
VQKASTSPLANFTFTKAGEYSIYVEAKDNKGATTKSQVLKVYAGNEAPTVSVQADDKSTFYFPGVPVPYSVSVKDREDGTTEKGGIDKKSIYVKVDYLSGPDRAQVVGHQIITSAMEGKNLAATLDCKACHKEADKSIGPSYQAVAAKYEKDPKAKAYLTNKIIKGGSGVWGEVAMSAHPDLKVSDAEMIVDYILGVNKKEAPSLPSKGTVTPTEKDLGRGNLMQITATYTDKGGPGIRPQSGVGVLNLKSPNLSVDAADQKNGVTIAEFGGRKLAILSGNSGSLEYNQMSLKHVKSLELNYGMQEAPEYGIVVSWHVDSPSGAKLGEVVIGKDVDPKSTKKLVSLSNIPDQPFKLVVKIEKLDPKETKMVAVSTMRLIAGN